jgi:hypothetical protein
MHGRILRRTGVILLAACVLTLSVSLYRGASGWSYSVDIDVLPLVAGIFLLRGSLTAAPIIRAIAGFGLGATIVGLIGLTLLQPIDLTIAELRLEPASFLWPAITAAVVIAVQAWTFVELGRASVQSAIAASGPSRWDSTTAAKAGAGVGILIVLLLWFMLHGASASAAEELALQQLGPDYRYALTRLNRSSENGKTVVSGVVTAWNDKEIKQVVLHWIEH